MRPSTGCKKRDIQTKADGLQYRGLSRNQICIGIGCDLSGHIYCTIEGYGKTSSSKTIDAFSHHIEPGSILVHDLEKSYGKLVKELELESEAYYSKPLKGVADKENPLTTSTSLPLLLIHPKIHTKRSKLS